jgi:hypothetical protein
VKKFLKGVSFEVRKILVRRILVRREFLKRKNLRPEKFCGK